MKRLLLFLMAVLYVVLVQGQAGELDPGFAKRGWTFVDMPKGNYYDEVTRDILLQDNKSVVLFQVDGYTLLTRYYTDGTLDRGFGFDGYSLPVNLIPSRAAQQSDGKIVVVGRHFNVNTSDYEIMLVRY